MARHLFTSESVTEGHPDKVCDQISDAVLDAIFEKDPNGRVACETCASTGLIHIMGEITTNCYVDIPKIARQVVLDIGYNSSECGFDGNTCAVITNIDEQSGDIALGVDKSYEAKASGKSELDNGAGDQGMMFGYACNETPELMPLAISIAHKMAKRLTDVRKQGLVDYLRPDGKTQITVEYGENGKPVRVDTVVLSTQHSPDVTLEQIRKDMIELVIKPTVPAGLLDSETKIYVNPTGRFVSGGPAADTGLTGRKIIVDTYGGSAPTAAALSPARTPPRWTAARPTPPAGWPRMWWLPVLPTSARCSWPTPSAWRVPSACWWRRSAPAWWPTASWRPLWRRSLTCAPPPSSAIWTCGSPFTASWRPMATWAVRTWVFPGKRPTVWRP